MDELTRLREIARAADDFRAYYLKRFRRAMAGEPMSVAEAIDKEPIRHIGDVCVKALIENVTDEPIPEPTGDAESMTAYLGSMYGRAELVRRVCEQVFEDNQLAKLPDDQRAYLLRQKGLQWKAIAEIITGDENDHDTFRKQAARYEKRK